MSVVLPELDWVPTQACGSRNGGRERLVVIHRWGAPYKGIPYEKLEYRGVINWFLDPKDNASSHFVMPGSSVPGKATQMVPRHLKAWTEAFYNPVSTDIECEDAIFLGYDPVGLHVTARMAAFELHRIGQPPVWVHGQALTDGHGGFCRHADLGSLGGGHLSCPTTDLALWRAFCGLVEHEYARGGFRRVWGH